MPLYNIYDIEKKIEKTESCWIWKGSVTKTGTKYGRLNNKPAHRIVYELVKGVAIKPGMELDHLCRVTLCVNPDHLEEVTKSENVKRLHKFQRNRRLEQIKQRYSKINRNKERD